MVESDERIKKLVDTARGLEGMPRNTSTHAAGVVITANPVSDYVPLARNDETIVTQFTMTTIEELGLLKMDFLGLRNLTILDDAARAIRRREPDFDLKRLPDGDAATFAMLGEGKTAGVFQLESAGITGVCVNMKPQSIEDLTAIVALYRPGPMDSIPRFIENKSHPERITYLCPQLEPILAVTYGCIVYQEQVIEIFRKLGGYSSGRRTTCAAPFPKRRKRSSSPSGRPSSTVTPRAASPARSQTACPRRRQRPFTRKFWISRTTPSTRRTPCAMPRSPMTRPISSATIPANIWRRC